MRRVLREADQSLSEQFKLEAWLNKSPGRCQIYFEWCDSATEYLSRLAGTAPRDQALIQTVMAALAEDDFFAQQLRRRGDTFLHEESNWLKLYRAGAATIYQAYLDAVEQGTWP